MEKVLVKFTKAVSGMEKGLEKRLPKDTADKCVALGVAEYVKESKKVAESK